MSSASLKLHRRPRADWVVEAKDSLAPSPSHLADMIDNSLGDLPHDVNGVNEEMLDDKQLKQLAPINNKKRCGVFLCLFSLSLLLIIPIVSITLYQFVTCFQMTHTQNLGKHHREDPSQSQILSDKIPDSSKKINNLNSTIVIARNSIGALGNNVTNNLDDGHYDPFFHTSKLSNSDKMINSNKTSSWMDDRVCVLNFFFLFLAFFFVMIILVLVVGVSFAN